jgi:hypothetical protein
MSNRKKLERNALFSQLAAMAGVHGYTLSHQSGRTSYGTVLTKWMESISPDGRVMPHCGHAIPGQPAMLSTDDPDPKIRCLTCALDLLGVGMDDRICHLCGRESATFREFSVEGTGQLVITGNACRACFADIFRGRPSPEAMPST